VAAFDVEFQADDTGETGSWYRRDIVRQVYEAHDLGDAYAVRGRLWAAGIHAIIRGRDLSAMRNLQITESVFLSVLVDDADNEQAQRILGNTSGG
jgi:hypothetical protein